MPSDKWSAFGGRAAYNRRMAEQREADEEAAKEDHAANSHAMKQTFMQYGVHSTRVVDCGTFGAAPPLTNRNRMEQHKRTREEVTSAVASLRDLDHRRQQEAKEAREARDSDTKLRERGFKNVPTSLSPDDDPYDTSRPTPALRVRSASPARSRSQDRTYLELRDIDKERAEERRQKHEEYGPRNVKREREHGWCPSAGVDREMPPAGPVPRTSYPSVRHRYDEWHTEQQEKMRREREREARVAEAEEQEASRLRKRRTRSPHQSAGVPSCAHKNIACQEGGTGGGGGTSRSRTGRHSTPPSRHPVSACPSRNPPLAVPDYYHRAPPPKSPRLSSQKILEPRTLPVRRSASKGMGTGGGGIRGKRPPALQSVGDGGARRALRDEDAVLDGRGYAVDDLAASQDDQIRRLANENRTLKDYISQMERRLQAVEVQHEQQDSRGASPPRRPAARSTSPARRVGGAKANGVKAAPPSPPPQPASSHGSSRRQRASPSPPVKPRRQETPARSPSREPFDDDDGGDGDGDEELELGGTRGWGDAPHNTARASAYADPHAGSADGDGDADADPSAPDEDEDEALALELIATTWIPRKYIEDWCATLSFRAYHEAVAGKVVRYINAWKQYTCGIVSGVADEDSLVIDGATGTESVKVYNISNTRVQDAELYPEFLNAVVRLYRAQQRMGVHGHASPTKDNLFAH